MTAHSPIGYAIWQLKVAVRRHVSNQRLGEAVVIISIIVIHHALYLALTVTIITAATISFTLMIIIIVTIIKSRTSFLS
jgi:hypothetical protein